MQILHLEKRLQDQFQVRCALEKALGYRSSTHNLTNENDVEMPKVGAYCLILFKFLVNCFYVHISNEKVGGGVKYFVWKKHLVTIISIFLWLSDATTYGNVHLNSQSLWY